MSADQIFSASNTVALGGWIVLIGLGRLRWAASLVSGVIIPLLLAILYSWLIVSHWGETPGGFGSLSAVAILFSNRWLLLAGWIHYLAFDLFVGSWQVRDSQRLGLSHWTVIPCLILTFLFGPAGLLTYFLVRLAALRTANSVFIEH